jgi:hypothetical protein
MLNVIKLFFEVDSFIRGHDSVDSIIYDLLLPSYMAEASLSEDPHYIMLLLDHGFISPENVHRGLFNHCGRPHWCHDFGQS